MSAGSCTGKESAMTDCPSLGISVVKRRILPLVVAGAALALSSAAGAQVHDVQGPIGTIVIPRNITYWQMFANATAVVKGVMMLLLVASVVSWTVWFSKLAELRNARRRLAGDLRLLGNADSLDGVGTVKHNAASAMIEVGRSELVRGGVPRSTSAAEGIKERATARLVTVETGTIECMTRGIAVLATIGAIAPFVGLFGTVWGIMNSFIGISQSNTTNLAVVAPGIAEALLATAMGLVAAIPAVVMYNHVARSIGGFKHLLAEVSTNVACLLSRDLDALLEKQPPAAVRAA
jgi:biopolymer transport protein ExbB